MFSQFVERHVERSAFVGAPYVEPPSTEYSKVFAVQVCVSASFILKYTVTLLSAAADCTHCAAGITFSAV